MQMIRKVLIVGNALGITLDKKIVSILDLKPGQIIKADITIIDESKTK